MDGDAGKKRGNGIDWIGKENDGEKGVRRGGCWDDNVQGGVFEKTHWQDPH